MSLLSKGKNGKINTYIKLIIFEAHLLEYSKHLKNIFPYTISIQINQSQQKFISPIKKAHEIFNISRTKFEFLIKKKDRKVLIRINSYSKTDGLVKKKIASGLIELENFNNSNHNKIYKKWYYLKNNNYQKIIKLLMNIELYNSDNIKNMKIINNNCKTSINIENNFDDKNLTINKPESINIHINSISNNNLNIITNNVYLPNFTLTSFNDSFFKENSINRTLDKNNNNTRNIFSNVLHEKKDLNTNKIYNSKTDDTQYSLINTIIKELNHKFSEESKNINIQKEFLEKYKNEYNQKMKNITEERNKFQKEVKLIDNKRQMYENQYLDLILNYNEFKKNLFRNDIINDINKYEKDVLLNINNMMINDSNIIKMKGEQYFSKNEFNFDPILKKKYSKDITKKSICNNYFNNNKGYSFESNGKTNIEKENDINNENIMPSSSNLFLFQKKKQDIINFPESRRNSVLYQNLNKQKLISEYSKSLLNLVNDYNELYKSDDIQEKNKRNPYKKNILNIYDILNTKNNNKKNKAMKNNNKINNNDIGDKKNNLYISPGKNKIKRISINDENGFNLYYNLESKKNENKYKLVNSNIHNKSNIKFKRSIFEFNTDYSFKKNNNNHQIRYKRITSFLNHQKTENIFHYVNTNNNIKKHVKNNQVFKNVLNSKIYNNKSKQKPIKKEKINSVITLSNETFSINNSILGINSLIPKKRKSFETTCLVNYKSHVLNAKINQKKNQLKTFDKIKFNINTKKLSNNEINQVKNYTISRISDLKNEDKKNETKLTKNKNKNYFAKITKNKKNKNNNIFKNKNN